MNTTAKAPQKALNLQAINGYLTKNIFASQLVEHLDNMVSDINYLYGESDGNTITHSSYSSIIYRLIDLRNVFLVTALDNGEKLDFEDTVKSMRFVCGIEQQIDNQ